MKPLQYVAALFLLLAFPNNAMAAETDTRLPGGKIVKSQGQGIVQAHYACPTTRYGHGILGDAIEAGCLVVKTTAGKTLHLVLPDSNVFEDITPRLADMNGDGKNDVVAILTSLTKGASLAVIGLRGNKLQIIAQTPYIGRSHRWLAPAGVADFDGDGQLEVAFVRTPHIGGTLEFWGFEGNNFRQEKQIRGFSNHKIGLTRITTSRLKDFDGDGITDIALPNTNWSGIRIISLAKGGVEIEKRPFSASFFNH